MRNILRSAGAILVATVVTLVSVAGPARADYDSRTCSVDHRVGRDSCQTSGIIPHNSELWVRVTVTACGNGTTTAYLRHAGSGEIVGGPYRVDGTYLPGDTAICNYDTWTVYGLRYRNVYYGDASSYGGIIFYGGVKVCNFTYDPSNGRTC